MYSIIIISTYIYNPKYYHISPQKTVSGRLPPQVSPTSFFFFII